jgi:hypothetical protein
MAIDDREVAIPVGPLRAKITIAEIWKQFWIDMNDKEVHCAATYTHHWVANALGHVLVGVLAGGLGMLVAHHCDCLGADTRWATAWGSAIALAGVGLWEAGSYWVARNTTNGLFPPGRKLLFWNAVVAFAYMALGVLLIFAQHQLRELHVKWWGLDAEIWGAICFVVLLLIGMGLASYWLAQKIRLQRSALPYLSRLSEAQPTMDAEDARKLRELINARPPPPSKKGLLESGGVARQVVVAGPIGCGRTAIAAGIGTEFVFKKARVRYLSLASLLEFAAIPPNPNYSDDLGPLNVGYWRWSQAQVLIIDDIGPLLAPKAQRLEENFEQFRHILHSGLSPIANLLKECHTIWVIGDLRSDGQTAMIGEAADKFADEIRKFCGYENKPVLVVELERTEETPRARTREA